VPAGSGWRWCRDCPLALAAAGGDGVAPGEGARLAEGDGCWVGAGVGESVGLPDGSGLPGAGLPGPGLPDPRWPGRWWPDGRPPAVPDGEPEGRWRRGEPDVDPRAVRRSGWGDPWPDGELAWPAEVARREEPTGSGPAEASRPAAGAPMVL
jgi:hypothetical protein